MLTSRFSVLLSTSAPLLTPTGWTFQCDVGRRLTPIHCRSQRLITLFVFNRPQERIRPHRYISCCCATRAGHPAGSRWLAQSSAFREGLHLTASCCALSDQIAIERRAGSCIPTHGQAKLIASARDKHSSESPLAFWRYTLRMARSKH
jgi:hypothetical protein